MAKKSKKNTRPKRKQRGTRMRSAPMPAHHLMSLAMQTCSVTNPFCPEAKGAKWPDNSYTKSAGLSYEVSSTGTLDANGLFANLYLPTLVPSVSNGTVTGTNAAYSGYSNVPGFTPPSDISRFRITTLGYKISCISSKMTTTGRLRLRLFSPLDASNLANVSIASISGDQMLDIPLSRLIDRDVYVIANPLGDIARLFRDAEDFPSGSATLTDWKNPGFQVLQVAVDGGVANSAALAITVYANYEYVYSDSSATQLLASAPPANSLVVREASASVTGKIGGIVEGSASLLDRIAQSSAFKYLSGAVAGLVSKDPNTALAAYHGANSITQARRSARMVD